MKTKILLLIVIISFLSSCTDDKNVKEINTELKSEKIEIYSINIDSAKFENNTKYLKEYANQSNKYLEKSTQILKENLEKNIINL
jgi:outer membrane lipoprotein-sorting protein